MNHAWLWTAVGCFDWLYGKAHNHQLHVFFCMFPPRYFKLAVSCMYPSRSRTSVECVRYRLQVCASNRQLYCNNEGTIVHQLADMFPAPCNGCVKFPRVGTTPPAERNKNGNPRRNVVLLARYFYDDGEPAVLTRYDTITFVTIYGGIASNIIDQTEH